MQIFSNVIVHSKGFNGNRAFKALKFFYQDHCTKKRLMTMKDYIPNQANLKTELVFYKNKYYSCRRVHWISKFIKLFQFVFNLLFQLRSHWPNPWLIKLFPYDMYSALKIVEIKNFQTSSSLAELGPAQPQLVDWIIVTVTKWVKKDY